jgi:uncharacterized protein with HEPN domain
MKRPDDDILLKDMTDHARMAVSAAAGKRRQDLDSDPILAAALERFVEIVGEAASRLSEEARSRLPGVPWFEVIGMRNRLVHGYSAVDRNILWEVVTSDLPALLRLLEH